MQQLLINPSRRGKKRRASSRKRRSGRRSMSALQLKYFGKGRKRRAGGKRRRARTITVHANPRRRRSRRASRSYRRNPSARAFRLPSLGLSTSGLMTNAAHGLQGAGGAVVTDIAMGQAAAFLPVSISSRYNAEGGINPAYYGTKLLLATALGALAGRFLPGGMKAWAARGVTGAFTVAAYEVARVTLPPAITMGAYLNPARIVAGGNGMNGMRSVRGMRGGGMRAYLNRSNVNGLRASFPAGSANVGADARIGEGPVT